MSRNMYKEEKHSFSVWGPYRELRLYSEEGGVISELWGASSLLC